MAKSALEKACDEMRKTLVMANRQARAMGDKLTNDRLKNIARVSNSYIKLLKLTGATEQEPGKDPYEHGSPSFYDELSTD